MIDFDVPGKPNPPKTAIRVQLGHWAPGLPMSGGGQKGNRWPLAQLVFTQSNVWGIDKETPINVWAYVAGWMDGTWTGLEILQRMEETRGVRMSEESVLQF